MREYADPRRDDVESSLPETTAITPGIRVATEASMP